jgi:hypothetical protein
MLEAIHREVREHRQGEREREGRTCGTRSSLGPEPHSSRFPTGFSLVSLRHWGYEFWEVLP